MNHIPEIIRTIPLSHYVALSSALFLIGVLGVLPTGVTAPDR